MNQPLIETKKEIDEWFDQCQSILGFLPPNIRITRTCWRSIKNDANTHVSDNNIYYRGVRAYVYRVKGRVAV